ncbi:MAG TPA: hypothetical protein VLE53_12225 [Gemmatimonadaceae bacterium]|nr:hypothetical protein [Gemmatimonadaceae bacterium]
MRRVFLLAGAALACAQPDTATSDSAAAAPAAPAALTAADVSGTWNGVSLMATGDSVLERWTAMQGASENEVKTVSQSSPSDTVTWTRVLDADSMVVTSAPFTPSMPPNSPQIVVRAVGRLVDGKLVGTSTTTLAAQPDSVVERARWEATRAP